MTTNTMQTRPRLKYAYEQLLSLVQQLGPNAQLPTMLQLRDRLGVSMHTLSEAVREMEKQGFVRSVHGVGIFVSESANQNQSKTLGLIMHADACHMTAPYTLSLLSGVRKGAAECNLKLQWLNSLEERNISREQIDAVLMYCHPAEALALGLPSELPQVLLLHHSPDFFCVHGDDVMGIQLAVEHLISLGHRNISYIAGEEHDSISQQRITGYHAALKRAEIPLSEKNVKFLSEHRSLGLRKSGEVTMEAWLEEGWEQLGSTAILAHNDDVAIGIVKALANHGLRVPEDVSVIGFDGTELCELCTPPLTTIKVPLEEIGALAVKILMEQMEKTIPGTVQNISFPVQLQSGESTALIAQRSVGLTNT